MKPYYLTPNDRTFIDQNKDKSVPELAMILDRPEITIHRHYYGLVKVKINIKRGGEPTNIDELLNQLSKEYAY